MGQGGVCVCVCVCVGVAYVEISHIERKKKALLAARIGGFFCMHASSRAMVNLIGVLKVGGTPSMVGWERGGSSKGGRTVV